MKRRFITLLIAMIISSSFMCSASVITSSNPSENVKSSSSEQILNSSGLITASELKIILEDEKTKIIDLRSKEEYLKEHIPGSINIINKEFENPDNPIDGEIATKGQFEALMSKNGISSGDKIIVYAESDKPQMAPRLIWTLENFGHDNTFMLDGQFEEWKKSGYKVTAEVPKINETKYSVTEERTNINVDSKYVLDNKDKVILLDVRPVEEYTGEKTPDSNKRGGHIEGAVNVPYMTTVSEDGKLKSVQDILKIYKDAGITPDKEIVVYCQRGHRASHTWFVLKYILGYPDVKIYDGSMMEWSNDESLPMEN